MSSGHALGSGNRPATMASMNAARDQQAGAAAGGGAAPPRDWSGGGRIRHVLGSIPLATLTLMLINLAVYFYQQTDDEILSDTAICYAPVVWGKQFSRIVSSAYFHLNLMHIGMNMMSFYYIGSSVEEQLGTLVAFGQTLLFTPLIGLLYLLLEYLAAQVMRDDKYLFSCAVGFSGVIFAFVIVDTGLSMQQGVRTRRLFGAMTIPIWVYPLLLLALLSLLMPGISFMGHLSGVIVGAFYTRGWLLPLSVPRAWLLALQARLPLWITNRGGWRPMPDVDPFESWQPSCLRQPRWHCPELPAVDGVGCAAILNLCARCCPGAGRGGLRRAGGQASGYAVGNAAGGRVAHSVGVAAQFPPRSAGGVGQGGIGGIGGQASNPVQRSVSPSRSSALLDHLPSRSFPALPSALIPSAPPPEREESQSVSSIDSASQGQSMQDEGGVHRGGAGGVDYSRLADGGDDIEMQPAQQSQPPQFEPLPPPRSTSLSPSAPLLHAHPSEDPDLEMAMQRSMQEL